MNFFDSHAHYNDERFIQNRDELIKKMYNDEITNIICAGYSLKSSEDAINFTKKYHHMFTTCGISPNDINDNVEKELEELEKIAKDPKCVAIGEIGLDYHWNKENKELQKKIFVEQIKMADRLDLPIVIHTREATKDTLDILKSYNLIGDIHCFSGSLEIAREYIRLGYKLGIGGVLTFKNSKLPVVLESLPIESILLETDSPYLAPEPVRGSKNESSNIPYIAKKIADIKKLSTEEVEKITTNNAIALFDLDI